MMCLKPVAFHHALKGIFALLLAASSGAGTAFAAASPWVAGHKAQARLVAGDGAPRADGTRLAFVEIALEPGWKTYWRTPGDAGGLPPSFDWSKSSNLAAADVMFPAPRRFTDKAGHTIGYEGGLVLPVSLKPEREDAPIALVVGLHYGICKDICIPVDAELAIEIGPATAETPPETARRALDEVPRPQDQVRPGDPVLVSAGATLDGAAPRITIAARFPEGAGGADAFLEAPDGLFLPLPELVGPGADGALVFEAPLDSGVEVDLLRGKSVTVTLVSETGASFATFLFE